MNLNSSSKILIIGCGWLGQQLGKSLSDRGHQVVGTTRSPENAEAIADLGIKPAILDVDLNPSTELIIPEHDAVFISLTPGGKEGRHDYPKRLDRLSKALSPHQSLVYHFSSTSAYGDATGIILESDAQPDPLSKNPILAGEGAIRSFLPNMTILRLAGLYGKDRHPVRYLAGRSDLSNGDAPVNLIHADDIVQICTLLLNNRIEREIYNLCSLKHPIKSNIYPILAKQMGLEAPVFQPGGSDSKIIDGSKIIQQFNYSMQNPDPINFNLSDTN